ncbi:glutaminyl-peptide cyclotransferase [Antarcticibacterium arcticum]|uniref:Glutaminyl-peptide cyclotransferase n=1 Tax=Antarcticibacterium arcticum TaxID=2585771 RepID=A0A5B8YLQ0_9FLAO|nr:glutaminyl-peptide cyclotransferase [Antarcticibacterium arcticum]QED37563.1 glutaminyl-peptide cyclotransferase [Antarcticibacterium arcticum]
MKKVNLLSLFILNLIFFSCGSNSGNKTSDFSLNFTASKTEYQLGETVEVAIKNLKNRQIDSVRFFLNENNLGTGTSGNMLKFQLKDEKLGNQVIKAMVFSEGEKDTLQLPVKIYNSTPPTVYTYKIVNTYPHDRTAYTQGLEFYRDTLYESTGQYGRSSLRKTNFETGEVLSKIDLADKYFGEGLSVLNDKIYQLTWNEGEGLIYDISTLAKEGSFKFNQSKEGWGLCNDGTRFYKSDGTEKIWILNGTTLAEETYIQPTTHRSISTQLNELEWVEGKIYANTYQKDGVAIINPENGAIEGLINFQGLRDQVTQHADLDVLNGIAYNPNTKKLYVTGKNWDKLFEVEIIKK